MQTNQQKLIIDYDEKRIKSKQIEIKNDKKKKVIQVMNFSSTSVGYGILIFWSLISLFPFFWSVFASFKDPYLLSITGMNPFPKSGQWTAINYTSLFTNEAVSSNVQSWITNSVIYSFGSAFLNMVLNLLGGYALAMIAMKGKNLVVMYFLVSILVPSQATFIPTYFIFTKVGIISSTISTGSFIAAVIFSGMANIIMTFMARQFFLTQTAEMEEAAKMDGYSQLGVFLRITLIKMLPLAATQFVLVFMGSWNNFLTFQLYSGGDPQKMTINSGAFLLASSAIDKAKGYGQALAISNISFIPMFVLYAFSLKLQLRGIRGGNK